MPKNNYLFQAKWLEDERFKHWITKKNDTVAICNSSVIRQKGESQNGCFKKAKHAKISEKQTFLTP